MKHVIVPQELLDNLEEARKELYAMHGVNAEDIDTGTLIKLQSISQPMWVLANTKWEEAK